MYKAFLRGLALFSGLSEEDLDRLYSMAEVVTIEQDELLMEEGEPGDSIYVVLEGAFNITKRTRQEEIVLANRGLGEVLGEISLLENAPRSASVRATESGRLLKISREAFESLLHTSPSASMAIVRTVMSRLRNTESMAMQHEKLAALGTLSAGLAHELNNPAAAVVRGGEQLRHASTAWQAAALRLECEHLQPEHFSLLEELRVELERRAAEPPPIDALSTSDRSEELEAWLDEQEVDEAWDLAPALAGLGWEAQDLDELVDRFPDGVMSTVGCWLGQGALVYSLLNELTSASRRMSEIVRAVKSYSHMDQAPVEEVDVHAGIEDTLVILRHKLKHHINIRREYARDLPRIEAFPAELNQAWTNLIDNAADAILESKESGEISIHTSADGDDLQVEICDDGPGIPDDVRPRIFEPFYTTKVAGLGSGLGLHIVRNIISVKHAGRISVESRPGHTCFCVTLPRRLPRTAAAD